jgi:DNA-binding Xre family transcriptional regulator
MFFCNIKNLTTAKERKEKRDISLRTVAAETGLSIQTVYKLASWSGVQRIDCDTIKTLCDYYNCNFCELVTFE